MTNPQVTDRSSPSASTEFDAELRAMQAILAALEGLDKTARQRVVDYVFERLGLVNAPFEKAPLPEFPEPRGSTDLHVPAASVRDIRTFKEQKNPRSSIEMAVLVAYYLAEVAPQGDRKKEIGSDDINTYFKQAGYPIPGRPRKTLADAKNAGYLDSPSTGNYRLNPVGHNLIAHSLPVAGGESGGTPRKRRRKPQNKQNTKGRKK